MLDTDPEKSRNSNSGEADDVQQMTSLSADPVQNTSARRSVWPVLIALLALVGTAGASYFGYQSWLKISAELTTLNQLVVTAGQDQQRLRTYLDGSLKQYQTQLQQLTDLDKQFSQQKDAMEIQAQAMQKQSEQMQVQSADMRTTLQSVYDRVGRDNNDWEIAEAEYLLQIANYKLSLQQDMKSARDALQAADERLRILADPELFEVRQQVTKEIAALGRVKPVDRQKLVAQLNAVVTDIPDMMIDMLEPRQPSVKEKAQIIEDTSAEAEIEDIWDKMLADSWKGFKTLVVVRHHEMPVATLLTADQQYFVRQNLQFQLETARFAILRGDDVLYRQSLQSAQKWLAEYFDKKDSLVEKGLQMLQVLYSAKISPDLPDISASLQMLQQRQKKDSGEKPS